MDNVLLKSKQKREMSPLLQRFYNDSNKYELCIDEVGRGCLFGAVYIACVVLPKDPLLFEGKNIKDSKKFSSNKKLGEVAEYIKQHALAWHVEYIDADVIDDINILQAVMRGMHGCIRETLSKIRIKEIVEEPIFNNSMAVIDGNYFTPYRVFDDVSETIQEFPHVTIEKGDATYMGIAAASILAKSERDAYITRLCGDYPVLSEKYGLNTNMGYGTKTHLDGIREHGITQWHRKTFGEVCRSAELNAV